MRRIEVLYLLMLATLLLGMGIPIHAAPPIQTPTPPANQERADVVARVERVLAEMGGDQ